MTVLWLSVLAKGSDMHGSNLWLRVIGVAAICVSGVACQQDVLDEAPDPDFSEVDTSAQPDSVAQAAACFAYSDQVYDVAGASGSGWGTVAGVKTYRIAGNTLMYRNSFISTGKSKLTMQQDGNLVLYDECGKARWASGTNGNPGAFAWFQPDGNLVVYQSAGSSYYAIWDTGTWGHTGANWSLHVQADGNLVIYAPVTGGVVAKWTTGTSH